MASPFWMTDSAMENPDDDAFGMQGVPPQALMMLGGLGAPPPPPGGPPVDMAGSSTFGPLLPLAGALAGLLSGASARGDTSHLFQGYALMQRHLENQQRMQAAQRTHADQEKLTRMRTLGTVLPKLDEAGLRQIEPDAEALGMGGLPRALQPSARARADEQRRGEALLLGQELPPPPGAAPDGTLPEGNTEGINPNQFRVQGKIGHTQIGRTSPSPTEQLNMNARQRELHFHKQLNEQMARQDAALPHEDRVRNAVQALHGTGVEVPAAYTQYLQTPDRARQATTRALVTTNVQQYLLKKSMQAIRAHQPLVFDANELGLFIDNLVREQGLDNNEARVVKEEAALNIAESVTDALTGGQRHPTDLETEHARRLARRATGGIAPAQWATPLDVGQTREGRLEGNIRGTDPTDPSALRQNEQAGMNRRLVEQGAGRLEPEGAAAVMDAGASPADALRAGALANRDATVANAKAVAVAPPEAINKAKVVDELFGDIYRANQLGQRLKASLVRYLPGALNAPLNTLLKFTGMRPQEAKLLDEYLQMIAKAFSEERLAKAGATLTPTELAEIRSWAPRADDNIAVALPNLERGTGWLAQRLDREAAELGQYGRTESVLPHVLPMYWKFGRRAPEEAQHAPTR